MTLYPLFGTQGSSPIESILFPAYKQCPKHSQSFQVGKYVQTGLAKVAYEA